MAKKIKPLAPPSVSGYLFCLGFGVGGVFFLWLGLTKLINGDQDGLGQFILSLVLGGGFLAFSAWSIQSFVRDQLKINWLNQNGAWIKATLVETETLTQGDVGASSSCKLIVEAVDVDAGKHDLKGVTFESEPVQTWSMAPDLHGREFDVVIDPNNPAERYFVNLDVEQ